MSPRARRVMRRFWALIDSESVRAFVWPYYIAFLAWGIYATFFAAPVTIVYPVMGPLVYVAWVWSCIVGPGAVMLGLLLGNIFGWLNAHVWMPDWLRRRVTREAGEYLGLVIQVGGNFCVGVVLLGFEWSGIHGAYWGQAAFSLFILPPYILGCLTLTLQAARKVWHIELVQRAIGESEVDP